MRRALLAAAVLLALAERLDAGVLTINLAGTVYYAGAALAGSAAVGDPFTASISLPSVPLSPTKYGYDYEGLPPEVGFQFSLGSIDISSAPGMTRTLLQVETAGPGELELSLEISDLESANWSGAAVFSYEGPHDTANLAQLPLLSMPLPGQGYASLQFGSGSTELGLTVSSLTSAPEPASILLVALASVGLLAAGLKRTA